VSVDHSASHEIENLLAERRTYPPSPDFAAQANAGAELYDEAERDFEGFWARLARERLSWSKPFETTLEWDLPFAKWFTGGELNVAYNCVDRHVENGLGDKVAYHWIGEPGDTRSLTFSDLKREVSKAANALKELGVEKGDRVAIYMPMIPELPIAMLACARIGAPHTVVFGGFSAEALSGRINDCGAKVLITADGGWRRGNKVNLKHHADEAVVDAPSIEHVIVVDRFGDGVHMVPRRDHWWHDLVDRQSEECPPEPVDSEHMLYLLYTSGTTAKPKGILHTTAGYLLGQRGYQVLTPPNGLPANAPRFDYFRTKIYYDASARRAREAATKVGNLFASAEVEALPAEISQLANSALLTVVVGQTFHGSLAAAPIDQTPRRERPNVVPGGSASRELLRGLRRKVSFPLLLPSVIERSSWVDQEMPARLYRVEGGHQAVRLVYRMGSNEYWGVQMTDWEDAPVLGGRNFVRKLGGRRYELYYNGPKLHMVVLRTDGASYWVVNTLLDRLSNETMIAIAKGLRPLGKAR